MKLGNDPYRDSYETMLRQLETLPHASRISEGLFCAARLIEESAYAHAREISGAQIVELILLAAKVEQEAEKIGESADPGSSRATAS